MARRKKAGKGILVQLSKFSWFFIIIGIILYVSLSLISSMAHSYIRTAVVGYGEINLLAEKEGIIIRDEYPMRTSQEGYISYLYAPGERVKKDSVIAEIRTELSDDDSQYKLKLLDTQISASDIKKGDIDGQLATIHSKLEFLSAEAQNRIFNREYVYLSAIKDQMLLLNDNIKVLQDVQAGRIRTNADMQTKKEEIVRRAGAAGVYIQAPVSGVLSTYSDGFEEKLSFRNREVLNLSDLLKADYKNVVDIKNKFVKDQVVGTVVNNDYYYIACEIEKQDINLLDAGKKVILYAEGKQLDAYLESFHKGSDEKFIGFFMIRSGIFKFYEKRVLPIKIEFSKAEGIKVPREAIIKNVKGEEGVFVVDRSNNAVFRPLQGIIGRDADHIILPYKAQDGYLPGKINLYDEVVITPKNIKEGQRVR